MSEVIGLEEKQGMEQGLGMEREGGGTVTWVTSAALT